MKLILTNGSIWPLEDLNDDDQKGNLRESLTFGNHNAAKTHPDLLQKLREKNVIHRYSLPLPLHITCLLVGVVISTMNIASQSTIKKLGQIVEKE